MVVPILVPRPSPVTNELAGEEIKKGGIAAVHTSFGIVQMSSSISSKKASIY
jgi:hypothetical protein